MWPQQWSAEDRRKHPCIIFFQENAGNMSYRLPFLKALVNVLKCSAFILSYRGYGLSEGHPTEQGLQIDADTAIRHLLTRSDIDPQKIVIFGRSLGGAVAIYAATKHKNDIKGLIVENTFTNIEETAGHAMPFLRPLVGRGRPCNWLVRNKWPSDRRIRELKDLPVLFLSSLADEMLHPGDMMTLYLQHGAAPWSFIPFENARHMDCFMTHAPLYWQAIQGYMDRLFGVEQ